MRLEQKIPRVAPLVRAVSRAVFAEELLSVWYSCSELPFPCWLLCPFTGRRWVCCCGCLPRFLHQNELEQERRETFASRAYHGESDFVPASAVELSLHCLNQTVYTEFSLPWKYVTHNTSLAAVLDWEVLPYCFCLPCPMRSTKMLGGTFSNFKQQIEWSWKQLLSAMYAWKVWETVICSFDLEPQHLSWTLS